MGMKSSGMGASLIWCIIMGQVPLGRSIWWRTRVRPRSTLAIQHESITVSSRGKLTSNAQDEWDLNRLRLPEELVPVEAIEDDEPHPLRTSDWRLEMRVRPWKVRQQEVTFHRNGTVYTSDGDKGDWWFDVGGLYWDVNSTVRSTPTVFHHKAELHWNIFGEQPRMFRGTVIRDRLQQALLPPWMFRPVVASFVGSGVGDDTADTSYRHRRLERSGEEGTAPSRVVPPTDRY